jgi:hypothetical protein
MTAGCGLAIQPQTSNHAIDYHALSGLWDFYGFFTQGVQAVSQFDLQTAVSQTIASKT